MSGFCKACSFPCTQYLVGAPSAWIRAWVQRGVEPITLWPSLGVMEAQIALIAAFRSSASLGLRPLASLLITPHRFSLPFRSGTFAGQLSKVPPWPLNQLLVLLAVWPEAKSCWNQLLHEVCQQQEAWGALKCPAWQLCWLQSLEPVLDRFHLWEIKHAYWLIFTSKEAKPTSSKWWKTAELEAAMERWQEGGLMRDPVFIIGKRKSSLHLCGDHQASWLNLQFQNRKQSVDCQSYTQRY